MHNLAEKFYSFIESLHNYILRISNEFKLDKTWDNYSLVFLVVFITLHNFRFLITIHCLDILIQSIGAANQILLKNAWSVLDRFLELASAS